jgi:hypothetical protein
MLGQSSVSHESGNRNKPALRRLKVRRNEKLNKTSNVKMFAFNKKHEHAMIALLTMIMLLLSMCLSGISPVSAQEIPRDQILWGAGNLPSPTSFNPLLMDEGQGWDTYMMYEPLFGDNIATGELIKWLGESITWVDSTTVQVTLRSGAYWVKIADWDGWQAGTADPVYYRPITTEDVKYSYLLYGAFDESPLFCDYMSAFRERVGSISNFEIVNDRVFKVYIKPEYANSEEVWRTMTRGYLIVPKDVWQDINATTGNYLAFANDWTSADTKPEWKVASGMYLPYYYDDIRTTTIMRRNDIWWGKNNPAFGRLPRPLYMGYRQYPSIDPVIADLLNNQLDWDGHYFPDIVSLMEQNPCLHTYLFDSPFFIDEEWYIYSTNYWIGWPDQYSFPLLPCSPYGSSASVASLDAMIFGLHPTNADLNGDGVVDISDITRAALAFGAVPGDPKWISIADVNNDRVIDIVDLTIVALHWDEIYIYE